MEDKAGMQSEEHEVWRVRRQGGELGGGGEGKIIGSRSIEWKKHLHLKKERNWIIDYFIHYNLLYVLLKLHLDLEPKDQ